MVDIEIKRGPLGSTTIIDHAKKTVSIEQALGLTPSTNSVEVAGLSYDPAHPDWPTTMAANWDVNMGNTPVTISGAPFAPNIIYGGSAPVTSDSETGKVIEELRRWKAISGGNENDHIDANSLDGRPIPLLEATLPDGSKKPLLNAGDSNLVFANDGDDHVIGGDADDVMFGGMGADRLYGEDGNDLLDGNKEFLLYGFGFSIDDMKPDILHGGKGDDRVTLRTGDTGYGDEGDDTLIAYGTNVTLHGGEGKNRYINKGAEATVISASTGDVYELDLSNAAPSNGKTSNVHFPAGGGMLDVKSIVPREVKEAFVSIQAMENSPANGNNTVNVTATTYIIDKDGNQLQVDKSVIDNLKGAIIGNTTISAGQIKQGEAERVTLPITTAPSTNSTPLPAMPKQLQQYIQRRSARS